MLQSMGLQRVGHDLVTQQQQFLWVKRPAWSSAQGLTRLQLVQCCLGCVLIWRLDWGRIFQAHSACQQNSFLYDGGDKFFAGCQLETVYRFQKLPIGLQGHHSSWLYGLLQHVHSFPPDDRESLSFQSAKSESNITKHNHESDIQSQLSYSISCKSVTCHAHTQGRVIPPRSELQEGETMKGHLRA